MDVAVADALDTHAADEIGFHLDAPVRVVRAPLAALEEGIARTKAPRPEGTASLPPPSRAIRGAPILQMESSVPPPQPLVSERPLPLVTHSSEPPAHDIPIPLSRRLVIPRITTENLDGAAASHDLGDDAEDEPVVELRRTKSSRSIPAVRPAAARTETISAFPAAPMPLAEPAPYAAAPESAPPSAPVFQVHQALRDMAQAEARDPLMTLVLAAVQTAASKTALFAVKKDAYTGWMCTPEFGDREELGDVRVDVRVPSVFATTAAAGAYVGPLLRNGPHAPLFDFVKSARPEVLAVSIKAAGKPAVIVFAFDVDDSRHAMSVMAEVARVAGEALERILRTARGEPMSQRGPGGPVSRR